jgi:hypothetical protein
MGSLLSQLRTASKLIAFSFSVLGSDLTSFCGNRHPIDIRFKERKKEKECVSSVLQNAVSPTPFTA